MAIIINDFSANEVELLVTATSSSTINFAKLIYTDGTVEDVLSLFTDNGVGLYSLAMSGDFSDGIYTIELHDTNNEVVYKTIGNLLVGTGCMLKSVLKEEYDCVLFQQLEAVKQLLMTNLGDLARSIYQTILDKCAECASANTLPDTVILEGISIWIVNDDFIVQ